MMQARIVLSLGATEASEIFIDLDQPTADYFLLRIDLSEAVAGGGERLFGFPEGPIQAGVQLNGDIARRYRAVAIERAQVPPQFGGAISEQAPALLGQRLLLFETTDVIGAAALLGGSALGLEARSA